MKSRAILIVVCFIATAVPLPANGQAPLGSPDFYPSPEHPVGWRGDGSGRFPGATPPAVWSRRLVDITSEIMVQAVKPNGKPGVDSHVLAYFTVKDWLVAGPFPAADPEKDIDNDFLGGEAGVKPDAGAKAGNTKWKAHRASEESQSYRNHNEQTSKHLWVNLVNALGTLVPPDKPMWQNRVTVRYADLDKSAAYAHTYLYSPRGADVMLDLQHDLPAVKIWVNGAPQRVGKNAAAPMKIHLNNGWNRLLVKAICDKAQLPWWNRWSEPGGVLGQTKWRFAAYIQPADSGPFSYVTKNIGWMTKLSGRSVSQPIVVGNKLFVGSGDTDLFCLDKRSGKILWMHTGTYWDAMTDDQRAAVKDKAAPLLVEVDEANKEMVSLLNRNITPQGLDTSRQTLIDKTLDERRRLTKSLHTSLSTGRKGRLHLNEVAASNATPTSDGKLVYWVVQGAGGYLISAFDLSGKLVWSNLEYQNNTGEHGTHRSPLLCEGKLIVSTNEQLIGYQASTGKELWRTPGTPHQHGIAGTPIRVEFNGRPALQTTRNLVGLDGVVLAEGGYTAWGCDVPVVEDGVLYNSCHRDAGYAFEAIEIPKQSGGKPQISWKLDGKAIYGQLLSFMLVFHVASPLYVEGLIYQIDATGNLVAIDTRAKRLVYNHWMDGYNFNDRMLYGYCASPTLAGKNIYLMDCVGYVTILKPGIEGAIVGNNILQNITNMPNSAPGRQEVFYAGMYFDGKRMFVHADEYMYCIQEK